MDLQKERDILFDENFHVISDDTERIKNFCKKLSNITGVLVCNNQGMLYEYIDKVYARALEKQRQQNIEE